MKEYFKKEYKPILIGIVAYWVLNACNELFGNMLIQTGIIKFETIGSNGTESWNWQPLLAITNIFSACTLIFPGFLSGSGWSPPTKEHKLWCSRTVMSNFPIICFQY